MSRDKAAPQALEQGPERSNPLEGELATELQDLRRRSLYRELEDSLEPLARVDFTSNDYLGLSRHPEVIAAALAAAGEHGTGARASRLLGGGCGLDRRVERAVADWLGAEEALLFPTGYQANLGLVTALARPGDLLLSDALNHASTIDACRLSRATTRIFAHGDLGQLEALLATNPGSRRRLVLTEGVFSMDGDVPPLAEMERLCREHDAWLIVDEAHAAGVVGPEGAGAWAAAEAASDERLLARVVTGGKALGAAGGLVVGSRTLRETVIQGARSFTFSTGISPAVAGALEAAVAIARGAEDGRRHLRGLARQLAGSLGLPTPPAAVLPYIVGTSERALALAERLQEQGLEVRAVRPPTVPEGSARLRLVLHAHNSSTEVEGLARELRDDPPAAQAAELRSAAPRPWFVVGTDTGIGKTVVSAALCRSLSDGGPTTYWKPVQTGDDSDTDSVGAWTADREVRLAVPQHEFPLPASPHEAAAAAGDRVRFEELEPRLAREIAELEQDGRLVVELAGGLLVPYDDAHTQADWLARVRPRLVLVARSGLGTLNHTLLTLEALRARRLEVELLVLVGEPHPSNRATLEARGRVGGVVELPTLDEVGPASLQTWVERTPDLPR